MLPPSPSVVRCPIGCRIIFDGAASAALQDAGSVLRLPVPLLGGPHDDLLLATPSQPEQQDGVTLFRTPTRIAGFVIGRVGDLESMAHDAYRRLLRAIDGASLYRVWNFVPQINAEERGLENYRRFCRARSIAFEEHFGPNFCTQLSAASAVGSRAGSVALAFIAGTDATTHFENPAQVPAFEYPAQYGPRSPSFARATSVAGANGRQIFVSGTAAIRDHRSVGAGNLDAQITCTIENLTLIGTTAGAGPSLGAGAEWHRAFKVYLRHPSDLEPTKARLNRELLRPTDVVQYLQADICRSELLIEIEATLTAAK
jgi:chorismate lyase / 3-hydroxybenzoate synthase